MLTADASPALENQMNGKDRVPITSNLPSTESLAAEDYKLYPIRYYAMLSMMFLGTSFSLHWNTFSPVSNTAAEYYETSVQTISWFALIIYLTSVITGVCLLFRRLLLEPA